jgi:hypothetical protein
MNAYHEREYYDGKEEKKEYTEETIHGSKTDGRAVKKAV